MINLTSSLAGELSEKKIRVNTVVPGLVRTELWEKLGHSAEKQQELFENGQRNLPVGFVATPEHIAEAYLYLVRAEYATGSVIVIGKSFLCQFYFLRFLLFILSCRQLLLSARCEQFYRPVYANQPTWWNFTYRWRRLIVMIVNSRRLVAGLWSGMVTT